MGLMEIAHWIKGGGCKRLVKQTGQEIHISGVGAEFAGFKIDVGEISSKIAEFYRVTQTTVTMDNMQYLLCDEIRRMDDNSQLKEDCVKMRLSLIVAFSQLSVILGSIKEAPSEAVKKELARWLREMGKLNKAATEALKPGPKLVPKGGKNVITDVLRYQDISEKDMTEAVDLLTQKTKTN